MSKQAFEHLLGYMIKAHKTQVKGLFCYIYTISGNSDLRETFWVSTSQQTEINNPWTTHSSIHGGEGRVENALGRQPNTSGSKELPSDQIQHTFSFKKETPKMCHNPCGWKSDQRKH